MIVRVCAMLLFSSVVAGCAIIPGLGGNDPAARAVETFQQADPSLKQHFFERSAGYAVFPSVREGGPLWGGAFDRGVLYEEGEPVGSVTLIQARLDFQFDDRQFREIIFFQTPDDVARLKDGDLVLSAKRSGIAATEGAGAGADYRDGIAVFLHGGEELMDEASVGGQSFIYAPKDGR